MPPTNYRISGRVLERVSRKGVANLTVEAWDRDTRFHDMLGSTITGADGSFSFRFDSDYSGDYGDDLAPDVFFKILRDGKLVKTTIEQPMMNLPAGETQVTLEIEGGSVVPPAGRDRVGAEHVLKVSNFLRQSDFKGVLKEQRDNASMLGRFVAAAGGALAKLDFEPLRTGSVATGQVAGHDTATAKANLAAQQVEVTEVKAFDPKTDAESVRALAGFPLRLKANDQVTLYEEQGIVRYYSITKPAAGTGADAATVARLDREMQLKAEEITRLKAELAAVQQGAADKDAQIEQLRTDLAGTQAEQRELSVRFSSDKLTALELQVKTLTDKIR